MWENWILDVTNGTTPPCFCPYEGGGKIIFGMGMLSKKCPGNLIGVFHADGLTAAKEWISQNPDWMERFQSCGQQ